MTTGTVRKPEKVALDERTASSQSGTALTISVRSTNPLVLLPTILSGGISGCEREISVSTGIGANPGPAHAGVSMVGTSILIVGEYGGVPQAARSELNCCCVGLPYHGHP